MLKGILKRITSFVLAFVMVWGFLPVIELPVLAIDTTQFTVSELQIAEQDNRGTWTAVGNTITGEVTSKEEKNSCGKVTGYESKNSTLTITNGLTVEAVLSFVFTKIAPAGATVTINGESKEVDSLQYTLAPGASISIYIATPGAVNDTTSVTLSGIALNPKEATVSSTFLYVPGCTYTVNGEVVPEEGLEANTTVADGFELSVVSGENFYGWMNTNDELLGTATTKVIAAVEGQEVYPKCCGNTDPVFTVGSKYYFDLQKAADAARDGTSKVIVTARNCIVPADDYTIPSGVTLLVPFDAENTLYTTEPEIEVTSEGKESFTKPTCFRTLTLAPGAKITVNGAISVGSKMSAKFENMGSPTGPYGHIHMQSTDTQKSEIICENGGNLYAWGFISGDGAVTMKSGSRVYEGFQLADWRGGNATLGVYNKRGTYKVFPFSQYYVQNVQVPMTYFPGAKETCVVAASISGVGIQQIAVSFIGDDGLFNLTSGTLTKDYDEETDRVIVEITGNFTVDAIKIELNLGGIGGVIGGILGGGSTEINSNEYVLPINGNMTINAKTGANVTFAYDMELLPGTLLNIEQGATCTVGGNLYVYDCDEFKYIAGENAAGEPIYQGYCSSGNNIIKQVLYVETGTGAAAPVMREMDTDAAICVNGTLTATAGKLYTTAGKANIHSTGSGTIITTAGTKTVTYQAIQGTVAGGNHNEIETWQPIDVTPAMLKNGGSSGTTYTATEGATNLTFTYDATAGVWKSADASGNEIAYTVTYNGNGATAGDMTDASDKPLYYGQQLAENTFTKTGYTFAGWSDGTNTYADGAHVTNTTGGDLTLYAQWTPKTNTSYRVEHWLENVNVEAGAEKNSSNYTFKEADNLTGTSDSKVTPAVKTYEGFTAPTAQEITIAADGSTVLQYYYTRNQYTITFNDGGSEIAAITQDYGTTVTAPAAPTTTGYTFNGWSPEVPSTMPVNGLTVTAVWAPVTYTITYNLAGGTVEGTGDVTDNPATYTIETNTITLINPTKVGYTFAGWTGTELTEATENVTIPVGSTGNRSYTATWTAIEYTISYDLTGGSLADGQMNPTSYTVESNDFTLTNPAREGYTFAGWTDGSGGEPQKTVTIVTGSTGNRTYTANWTINQYTISFDTDGGNKIDDIQAKYNVLYNEIENWPDDPQKEGYAFIEWQYKNGDPFSYDSRVPANDVELKAVWRVQQFSVSFYDAEGIWLSSVEKDFGTEVTAPELDAREGYTFEGWVDEEDNEVIFPMSMPATNLNVHAVWTANAYTITFDTDGGSAVAPITQGYETAVTSPADPTKMGYTFKGWEPKLPSTMPLGGLKVKAVWELTEYTIAYDLNGGNAEGNPTTYTILSDAITLNTPAKTGCEFTGWTGTGLSGAEMQVVIPAGSTGERVYTANWNVVPYTIEYDLVGGTVATENLTGYTVETETFTLTNPTKPGYIFAGWTGTGLDQATKTVTIATGSTGDRSYTATWTLDTYTIGYDLEGGTVEVSNPATYDVLTNELQLINPTKPGYTFAGWTGTGLTEATMKVVIPTGSTGNRTYTANWEANTYTVQFLSNGGSGEMAEQTFTYDVEAALPENTFERTGYSFAGWKDGDGNTYSEGANVSNLTSTPDGVVTLTAQWNLVTYEISYELNGGVADGNPTEYTVEDAEIALTNPTKTGYTFAGWTGTGLTKATMKVDIPKGSTGNREYTATWTPNDDTKYTVNHWFQKIGGGAEHIEENFDKETIEHSGITGNTVEAALWQDYTGFTAPDVVEVTILADGSATVDYYYTRKSYAITYLSEEDSVFKTITLQYGADIPAEEKPAKEGYTFTGWDKDIPETMPDDDVTITAQWEIETYTIIFKDTGESVISNITAKYGESIVMPETPVKAGHRFDGWSETLTSMPDCGENGAEKEITATWTSYLKLLTEISEADIQKAVAEENADTAAMMQARSYYVLLNDQQKSDYATLAAYTEHHNALFETVEAYESAQLMAAVEAAVEPTNTVLTHIAQIVLKESEGDNPPLIETVIINDKYLAADMLEVEFLTKLFEYEEVKQIRVCGLDEDVWPIGSNPYTLNRGYDSNGEPITGTTQTDQFNIMFLVAWACLEPDMGYEEFVNYLLSKETVLTIGELDGAPIQVELIAETEDGFTYTVPYKFRFYNQNHNVYWLWGEADEAPFQVDSYAENSAVKLPAEPAKEGYTFTGWVDAENKPVTADENGIVATMGQTDLVYTAKWQINQYTITFDTDGGSEVAPITQDYATAVTAPANPTKEGYTFDGWDKEIPATMPAENMTITATWTVNNYKLIWNVDGVKTEVTYAFGEAVETIAAPSKTGYNFAGWDVEIPATMPAENMTITAQWAAKQYQLQFNLNGADGSIEPKTVTYDQSYGTLSAPSRTGYTFAGWYLDEVPVTAETIVKTANDHTLTAQWTPNTYTVVFNANGGTGVMNSQSFTYDAAQKLSENEFSRTGYTFKGWATADDGAVAYEDKASVKNLTAKKDGTVTLYAVWTANEYQLHFNLNGPDGSIASKTVFYDQAYGELPEPTWDGYAFKGWYTASVGGDVVNAATVMQSTSNIIVYAQWNKDEYTIAYNLDGGSVEGTNAKAYSVTSESFTLINPTKTGYDFVGWTGTGLTEATMKVDIPKGSTGDRSYTANWSPVTYEIAYNLDGGSLPEGIMNPGGYTIESADITLTNPTRTGYAFAGWTGTGLTEATQKVVITKGSTGPRAYTATWTANTNTPYRVEHWLENINVEAGAEQNSSNYTFKEADNLTGTSDSKVTPAVKTYEGFTAPAAQEITIAADGTTVLKYYYTRNQYTITFKNGDATHAAITKDYGAEIAEEDKPADPTKEGYTFTDWDAEIPEKMPAENRTITAQWTVNQYALTWNYAGGMLNEETSKTEQVNFGTQPVVPGTPVREGYSFAGWDGLPATMPDEPVTVTAKWTPNKYTVTINAGGGVIVETGNGSGTVDVTYDDNYDLPVVTRTGYTFTKWTDKDGTEVTAASTLTTTEQTLTANWEANKYKVQFDANGGTVAEQERQVTYDSTFGTEENKLPVPERSGYKFLGWYIRPKTARLMKAAETKKTYIEDGTIVQILSDEVLVADWEIVKYTITYDPAGGSVATANPETYTVETGDFTLTNPTKTGYTFIGWTGSNGETPETVVTIKKGSVDARSYTANWEINQYTITFDTDGGTAIAPITQDYNTAVTAPANPTRTGYSFAGWDKEIPATMPAENLTITAKWTINQYTITFDVAGGSEIEPIKQDYGTAVTKPADPTKTGSTFAGWDAEIPATMPAENVTITAKWTINQYTITFNTDGGTAIEAITQDYNTAVTAPADLTKTGSTFAGWDAEIPATMPAENVTITAKWTINQYTITFDTDGGTAIDAITRDYGTAVTAPADPTKVGYTFAGWDAEIPATMPAENLTITAKWTINQYTITFNTDGGTAIEAITQDYGTAVTKPADPTKEGYTFAGWDNLPATMPAENVTVKAQWTINQYTITFDVAGGSEIEPIKQDYGTAVTKPADPTKEGYTFAGWDVEVPATMPAENVTITASWKINQYTITFNTDGGSEIAAITQDYNTAVTAPVAPTKTGHTFAGWDKEIPATMPAEDVTITAQWTINQYTITFKNGDDTYATITKNYGEKIESGDRPVNPSKTGHTFAGWDKTIPGTMPAENMTITAKWKVKQYTITFTNTGESKIDAIKQDYGSVIVSPENPVRTGYTFAGWDKEIPATMPAEDVTIKAQWTINQYTITFDTDGGSAVGEITADYGASVTTPVAPTKEGYTFTGWSPAVPSTIPAEDVVVKATWKINQYTITFANTGESVIASIKQDYGTTVAAPADPSKTGYTFAGWDAEIPATMPAEDVTITAKWTINQYTITFDTAGGSEIAAITQDYNTAVTAPADPTKVGYTFKGWDKTTPANMPAGDMTITARWEIETYTVVFEETGESVIADITAKYGDSVAMPEDPVKAGYRFDGWSETLSSMPDCGENGAVKVITATWTSYLDLLTAIPEAEIQNAVAEENADTAAMMLARSYYAQLNDAQKTAYAEDEAYQSHHDVLFKTVETFEIAKLMKAVEEAEEPTNHVLSKNGNSYETDLAELRVEGSDAVGMIIADDFLALNMLYVPFLEELFAYDAIKQIYVPALPTGSAVGSIGQNPYTLNRGVGVSGTTSTDQFNIMFLLAWQGLAPGSEFKVFFDELQSATTTLTLGRMDGVKIEVELWAETDDGFPFKQSFTISFYNKNHDVYWLWGEDSLEEVKNGVADANTFDVISYAENSKVLLHEVPTKEGYTFMGWVDAEGKPVTADENGIVAAMERSDLVYTAVWKINEYTITFADTGDVAYEAITENYGTAIPAVADPVKTGYTFVGWSTAVPTTMPAENMTITAQWTPNQYTITFDTNGGTKIAPITQDYGTAVTAPADPSKIGYTFDGWDTEIPATMPAENVTITASWKINQYTITFDTDGGTTVAPITKDYDGAVTAPADPTKEGHTFGGWDKEIPTNMPAEDMTITAKWTVNQYTITFNTDGGTAIAPITQDYGTDVTAPADPTKEGYTFKGWNQEIPATMPAGDMTITAGWTINQYTITFDTNGGTAIEAITQGYNTAVTAPDDPTKVGYTFAGWDVEVPETMPAGDLTITAKWTVNNYTLTWNVDGVKTDVTYAFGAPIDVPADPIKEGYNFAGWDKQTPATMPAKDMELKATWTAKTYQVTLKAGEGTFADGTSQKTVEVTYDQVYGMPKPVRAGWTFNGWKLGENQIVYANTIVKITSDAEMTAEWQVGESYDITYDLADGSWKPGITVPNNFNVETDNFTLPEPVKEGYTFIGWTGSNGDKAETVVTIEKGSVGARSYTANWTINQYTITFNTDGGSEIAAITQDYNTAVTAPAAPTKTGYTFAGWDNLPATMPAANVTVKAKWTINQYTITFDTDGGTAIKPIKQDYGTAISVTAPAKEGYTFLRWEPAVPATMPAENMTVKAIWDTNVYTITFNTDGGTTIDPITQAYSTTVTAPAAPTKIGHTFDGWSVEIPATMPAGDMTITAKWKVNQYTITFDTAGGSTIDKITRDYGAAVPAVANPTREGHTFAGWDQEIPKTMPAGDMTITANWKINQYTITFNTDGGTVIDPITQDYGTAVTAPADPTKEGYTFKGWDNKIPATMPAGDRTITANWTINQYTITFDSDGGTKINSKTQNYGTAIDKPADPTKVGYTFKGWEPAVPETMPGQNLTVKAQWQINQYTISFNEDGGSAVAEITQDYNTAVTAPDDPTKEGHTFQGWVDAETGEAATIPAVMPARDVELKANWKVNQYTITFANTGDKDIPAITADYGKTVAQPAAPTKTGYSFAGWVDASGKSVSVPNTMPAEDLIIYASWTINQYTLTYDTDGGNVIPAVTADYGTAINKPADPTKTGYTFLGWSPAVPNTMPGENVTLKAQWKINQYTITFDSNGGSAVNAITQNYGTVVTAPKAPERPGYTFNGWNPALPGTMPAQDLHLVAQWVVNGDTPYTVNHWQMDLNGEYQLVKTETPTGAADTEATAQLMDTTGFTISDRSVLEGTIKGDGSLELNVYYERTRHSVKWNVNGVITEESVFYGAEPVFKGNTAKADDDAASYTFLGWDKEISAVTAEVTYTAQYQAIYEAATINADGTVAHTWRTLKLALANAVSGQTVRLEKDLTLTEDLVVRNGVTLLIPCVDNDSGYQTYDLYDVEGSHIGYIEFNHSNPKLDGVQRGKSPKEYQYRLLTIPEGRTLTVRGGGRIMVNSVSGRPSGGTYDMDITGGYGKICVDGQLVVDSTGTLENFGYMDGEGQVWAKNGGTIGDLFIVRNWRGGSQALSMYNMKVFPLAETQCHNIQCDVRLDYGSALNGMGKMFATHPNPQVGAVYFYTRFPLIGNDNSLIRMAEGSYLIRSYDAEEDREIYEFHGGGSFASSALELVGMDVSSDEYLYPLDGDMRFILCDGDYYFANHHKALPGLEMIVRGDATLTVNKGVSVVFYDKFDDTTIAAKFPGTGYDQTRDPAVLILEDGSVFTNNGVFAGKIQTTSDNVRLGKDVSTKWDISTIRKPTETQVKQSEWAPWSTAPKVYLYREGFVKNDAMTYQEMAVFLELERPGYTWRFGEAARGEIEKSIIWEPASNVFAVNGTVESASTTSVTVKTELINTTGMSQSCTLMIATYNSSGKMLDATMKAYALTSKDTNVTEIFNLSTRQKAAYVKIFVLESDGSFAPMQTPLKRTVQ